MAGRLEQHEGADDVRVDEGVRAVDRPVDVRLGRQIQHSVGAGLFEDARHRRAIGDVAADERDARVLQRAFKIEQAAGIGQLVDDDEAISGVRERVVNEVGADKTSATGDKKSGHVKAKCRMQNATSFCIRHFMGHPASPVLSRVHTAQSSSRFSIRRARCRRVRSPFRRSGCTSA